MSFQTWRPSRLVCGTPPLEALKAIISIAANHKQTFSIMHVDMSLAYFHAKATCTGTSASGDSRGADVAQLNIAEEYVRDSAPSKQLGA